MNYALFARARLKGCHDPTLIYTSYSGSGILCVSKTARELVMKKFEVNGEDDDRYRQWIGRLMIIDAMANKMKKDPIVNICSGRFQIMTLLGKTHIPIQIEMLGDEEGAYSKANKCVTVQEL